MIDPKTLVREQIIKHREHGRCRVVEIVKDITTGEVMVVALLLMDMGTARYGIVIGMNLETGQFEKVPDPVMLENRFDLLEEVEPYQVRTNSSGDLSIWCSTCGTESYNPYDVRELYCGHCHRFHCPGTTGTSEAP